MNIGPMEFFLIAVICTAPLLTLFVIIEITVSIVRYQRKKRRQGSFSWPTSSQDDDL